MRARLAASAVLIALMLGGATGCTFVTPQATTESYDVSDGISATIGDIEVRNALLLTADGTTASLLINLENPKNYGIEVSLQYRDSGGEKVDRSVYVKPDSVTSFGGEGSDRILLSDLQAQAGSLFPVFIRYGDVTGKQLLMPVLDGEDSHYAQLVP